MVAVGYIDPGNWATDLAGAAGFQAVLRAAGIPSTVRQRRGIDVAAGCGQLAGRTAA